MDYLQYMSQILCDINELPDFVTETTKKFIADYYASVFAGYRVNAKFNRAAENILFNCVEKRICNRFGLPDTQSLSTEDVAYLNAIYAHGADMDDGNRKSMGHIAAHVMSAVFALADSVSDCTWNDVLVAINIGYELFNRIGAAAQPYLAQHGFHSTGLVGGMASAGACAKLLHLDADGIYNAVAIAAIQSSGMLIVTGSGQACKPLNAANAARVGLLSAKMAQMGIRGPVNPLNTERKGWFPVFSSDPDYSCLTEGLGKSFTITESYLKPYPSCRHTHAVIEAAINCREQYYQRYQNDDIVSKIDNIVLHIYPNAVLVAGQVIFPQNADEAKFSLHYALAMSLLTGHFNIDSLSLHEPHETLKQVIGKITVKENAEFESDGKRGCKVVLCLNDGNTLSSVVNLPGGDPNSPMSWQDIDVKMSECVSNLFSCEMAKDLIRNIQYLKADDRYQNLLKGSESFGN